MCRRRPAGRAEAHAGRGTASWQGSGPPGGTDPPPPHTAALHSSAVHIHLGVVGTKIKHIITVIIIIANKGAIEKRCTIYT